MDAEDDGGLLNISVCDSDDACASEEEKKKKKKKPRDAQTEEDFQAVKEAYRPKVENGEVWKRVKLPLGHGVPKPEAQELLHAVEELYFFRRYAEALDFLGRVFESVPDSGLDDETRILLEGYRRKLTSRVEGQGRDTPVGAQSDW